MAWNQNLTNLRNILVDLYFEKQQARRVAEEARLQPAFINFDGAIINVWQDILRQATNRDKVDAIVDVAVKDFPDHKALQYARQNNFRFIVAEPAIDDKAQWQAPVEDGYLEKVIDKQSNFLPIHFLELGMQKSRPVARVVRDDDEIGSGFLIHNNLFVTNNHVLPDKDKAAGATLEFNYQRAPSGLPMAVQTFKLAPDDVFHTTKVDDWTVVKVQGDANADWGEIPLARATIKKDERAIIIQHPGGGYKQIALYNNVVVSISDTRVQYLTNTMPGSSGSPVFDNDWNIIAVHYRGGFLPDLSLGGSHFRNEGIHINVIVDALMEYGLYQ